MGLTGVQYFLNKSEWALVLIPLCLFFLTYILFFQRGYNKWLKTHWSLQASKHTILLNLLYSIFFILMSVSLLDIRGPEEKIRTNIPDQKTIILIDVSSSMLVEDVRPNRFRKALMLARHFVKNAAGHQIALVLFSDTQRRIVPFTDDVDLLESRLSGLEDYDLSEGGSSLSFAINESIQYFLEDNSKKGEIIGNILLLSDSEENGDELDIDVPEGISLAFVGMGTLNGGTIPIRDRNGYFRGNKTYKGKEIISKLDEEKIRSIDKKIKNFQYWIPSSYNIPTEEILSFFRAKFNQKIAKGEVLTRPVEAHKILIPALAIYVMFVIFGRFKNYKILIFILCFLNLANEVSAQEDEQREVKKSELTIKLEDKIFQGQGNNSERLKLAEEYLKMGDIQKALTLYKEGRISVEKSDPREVFNWATALIQSNQKSLGLNIYRELNRRLGGTENQLREMIQKNTLLALSDQQQKNEQKQNKDDKKEQDQKDSQDQNNEQKENQSQQNQKENQKENKNKQNQQDQKKQEQNQNNQSQNSKEQQDKKEKGQQDKNDQEKQREKNKEDSEKKDQNKDGKEDQEKKENQSPQSIEDKENQIKQQRKMVKVPALLKQLMNNDRQLQKNMFDTSTDNKQKGYDKKDW